MSLSSILYQSARNRFNAPLISKPITKNINENGGQKVVYTGYNPNTDKQIYKNSIGENVEAINNNQGKIYQSNRNNSIIYQGHVVG